MDLTQINDGWEDIWIIKFGNSAHGALRFGRQEGAGVWFCVKGDVARLKIFAVLPTSQIEAKEFTDDRDAT